MRKVLTLALLALCLGAAGSAQAGSPPRPIPNVVCGGSCDPGSILPPCTASLAGYWGYVAVSGTSTKDAFYCNGRYWEYRGRVPA